MRRLMLGLIAFLLTLPPGIAAQTFEGTLRQRTITVRDAGFDRLVYGDEGDQDDPGAEAESEEAYVRQMAARVFAVPLERVLAVAREEDGDVEEVTIQLKGSRLRVDVTGMEGWTGYYVMDLEAGTTTMVNTTARYYAQWSMGEMENRLRAVTGDTPRDDAGPAPVARDLGRSLTVAGTSCQGVEILLPEEGIVWGWVSGSHGALQRAMRNIGEQYASVFGGDEDEAEQTDVEDLLLERGFPLRVQRLSGLGMGSMSYEVEEVLSVDPGAVPDDRFAVPAGFTKKTLQEIWGR